jgi:hypothetical protein
MTCRSLNLMRVWIAKARFVGARQVPRIVLVFLAFVAGGRLPWLKQSSANIHAENADE